MSKSMFTYYGGIWRSLAYRVSIQEMAITKSLLPEKLKKSYQFCTEDFSWD